MLFLARVDLLEERGRFIWLTHQPHALCLDGTRTSALARGDPIGDEQKRDSLKW